MPNIINCSLKKANDPTAIINKQSQHRESKRSNRERQQCCLRKVPLQSHPIIWIRRSVSPFRCLGSYWKPYPRTSLQFIRHRIFYLTMLSQISRRRRRCVERASSPTTQAHISAKMPSHKCAPPCATSSRRTSTTPNSISTEQCLGILRTTIQDNTTAQRPQPPSSQTPTLTTTTDSRLSPPSQHHRERLKTTKPPHRTMTPAPPTW